MEEAFFGDPLQWKHWKEEKKKRSDGQIYYVKNPYWRSPIISCAYGISLERRMLDKILYEAYSNDMK
jgi:hypothetical protein